MKKYSWLPRKPKLFVIVSTIIGMAIGVLLILYAWQLPPFFMNVVATNDAYIQSSTTILSPQVSGYITEIYVKDFKQSKKDSHFFKLINGFSLKELKKQEQISQLHKMHLKLMHKIISCMKQASKKRKHKSKQ